MTRKLSALNAKAIDNHLIKIASGIAEFVTHRDNEDKKELLDVIGLQLDDLDQNDFFGTEGWRHSFGLNS